MTAPNPYPMVNPMTPTGTVYVPAKTNHVLHLILTVLTLGCWLPFWGVIAVVNNGKYVRQESFVGPQTWTGINAYASGQAS